MLKWDRTADTLHAAALMSHVACCGAPLVLNLLALAFGAGLVTAAAPWMEAAHGALHGREGVLLSISAGLVALGGVTQYLSWRADQRHDACAVGHRHPRASRRALVFGVVCALFLGNVALYAWHHDRAAGAARGAELPSVEGTISPA